MLSPAIDDAPEQAEQVALLPPPAAPGCSQAAHTESEVAPPEASKMEFLYVSRIFFCFVISKVGINCFRTTCAAADGCQKTPEKV